MGNGFSCWLVWAEAVDKTFLRAICNNVSVVNSSRISIKKKLLWVFSLLNVTQSEAENCNFHFEEISLQSPVSEGLPIYCQNPKSTHSLCKMKTQSTSKSGLKLQFVVSLQNTELFPAKEFCRAAKQKNSLFCVKMVIFSENGTLLGTFP